MVGKIEKMEHFDRFLEFRRLGNNSQYLMVSEAGGTRGQSLRCAVLLIDRLGPYKCKLFILKGHSEVA